MKLVTLLMFISGGLRAAPVSAPKESFDPDMFVQEELHHKLFWSSVAAFGLSSGFDFATSVKLNDAAKLGLVRERNTFLRNSYGGFDPAKGLLIKGGSRAVLVLTEVVLRRKLGVNPRESKLFDRSFTALNFALSGFFVKIAVNNIQLGRKHGVY